MAAALAAAARRRHTDRRGRALGPGCLRPGRRTASRHLGASGHHSADGSTEANNRARGGTNNRTGRRADNPPAAAAQRRALLVAQPPAPCATPAPTSRPRQWTRSWSASRGRTPCTTACSTYDKQGNVVGNIAENYSLSPDGLTWTFNIRKGIKFHNGDPMTAADVVFSIQRFGSKESTNPWSPYILKNNKSITAQGRLHGGSTRRSDPSGR